MSKLKFQINFKVQMRKIFDICCVGSGEVRER